MVEVVEVVAWSSASAGYSCRPVVVDLGRGVAPLSPLAVVVVGRVGLAYVPDSGAALVGELARVGGVVGQLAGVVEVVARVVVARVVVAGRAGDTEDMTLAMPDSIYPERLAAGFRAYLGYVDGLWPTAPTVRAQHRGADLVTLTVLGGNTQATGCDIEPGDLTVPTGVAWIGRQIGRGQQRPIIYASAARMPTVLTELGAARIPRPSVRLLSAHYGIGEHICGPGVKGCGFPAVDGTQWTDAYPGIGGPVDMSALQDDFFGIPVWQEEMMQALPTVKLGAAGEAVRTVQGACCARSDVVPGAVVVIDGTFGVKTLAAVKAIQDHYLGAASADGIVGPETWPVLLGI